MYIKKIKPLFTTVVVSADRYEEDVSVNGIYDVHKMSGALKDCQTVMAVGDMVKNIDVGDLVSIDLSRYAVLKHSEGSLKNGVISDNPVVRYNLKTMELDGKECILLQDRDIEYVIEDYEEIQESKSIIVPEKHVVV